MSAETYTALEDAVRAHLADESTSDGIATDWYLIVAAESLTEHTTHYVHIASTSPLHTLHGLVDLAHRRLLRDEDTDLE